MNLPATRNSVLAVAVVAALAGIGIVTYVKSGPVPKPSRHQRPRAAAPSALLPTNPPGDLRFTDYSGIALPNSTTGGPHDQRDGLAARFTRTPTGALMAAVHISVRSAALWGPKVFEPTISRQVIGPDRTLLLEACRSSYEDQRKRRQLPAGAALGRGYALIEAFRWQTYTPDSASVDLVSAGPGDQGVTVRASTRIQLQWTGGDWRVLAPPGGDWGNTAMPILSTTGYSLFQVRG